MFPNKTIIDILEAEFKMRGNLKYTLIYVPEGIEPNYDVVDVIVENSTINNGYVQETGTLSESPTGDELDINPDGTLSPITNYYTGQYVYTTNMFWFINHQCKFDLNWSESKDISNSWSKLRSPYFNLLPHAIVD